MLISPSESSLEMDKPISSISKYSATLNALSSALAEAVGPSHPFFPELTANDGAPWHAPPFADIQKDYATEIRILSGIWVILSGKRRNQAAGVRLPSLKPPPNKRLPAGLSAPFVLFFRPPARLTVFSFLFFSFVGDGCFVL